MHYTALLCARIVVTILFVGVAIVARICVGR